MDTTPPTPPTPPELSGINKSLCNRCGMCCWDWKGGTPQDTRKCESLADDLRTCTVYPFLKTQEHNCHIFPLSHLTACDLPDTCGYKQAWKKAGLI